MLVVKVAFSLKSVKMQRGNDEKLCVQWSNFGDNIRSSFEELREDKDFTDVTLACEDGLPPTRWSSSPPAHSS